MFQITSVTLISLILFLPFISHTLQSGKAPAAHDPKRDKNGLRRWMALCKMQKRWSLHSSASIVCKCMKDEKKATGNDLILKCKDQWIIHLLLTHITGKAGLVNGSWYKCSCQPIWRFLLPFIWRMTWLSTCSAKVFLVTNYMDNPKCKKERHIALNKRQARDVSWQSRWSWDLLAS